MEIARREACAKFAEIVDWAMSCREATFMEFEKGLIVRISEPGRLLVSLFLWMRQEYWQGSENNVVEEGEKRQGLKPREFGTVFGKVKYWRTYLYREKKGGGRYPLDIELGIPWDGFSMQVRSLATRIATKMSYAQTVAVPGMFLHWSPCQKTVEEMVLGLGRHTGEWFKTVSAPKDDGDVLIIQIDGKGTPTATEGELNKRRGKRKKNPHPGSQRHRGRKARKLRGPKKRRKKGDKSKNAKMATVVVMYTLKRSADGLLEGPINKRVYASYAPKRHAFAYARREADKRGFTADSGKLIQIAADGDNDLELYAKEFFPGAIHTIDIFHAVEYIWKAAGSLYKEGGDELAQWAEEQKRHLYEGLAEKIVEEIDRRPSLLPKRGPGSKTKRETLEKTRNYLNNRLDKMDYKTLREQDLEISSGSVEGAVNYVIAKRFDNGGMRWIKERAEALLQLRCIEINGDWDDFISYVHDATRSQAQSMKENLFLKKKEAGSLPTYGIDG